MRKLGLGLGSAFLLVAAMVALCGADIKFSALPLVGSVGGAERLVAIQGSGCPSGATPCNNVAITPAQISAYVATSPAFATTYQPLDADLTSLAGASAVGNIYYRSGAGTWSPVALGPNLALSAGSLSVTGVAVTGGAANFSSHSVSGSTPSSSTATCTAGQITWDASYLYVCTATNTWKRSALSTF